ncbi:MAG: peptide deformylase [Bacteroidales bacterium]|nr:peptide deformylase [Bacteroidales bacterium]
MVYPIYVIGTDVLREEGKDLPIEKTPELEKLIADMFETMNTSEGVGLAAPQIGKSLKLFVIDLSPLGEDEPSLIDFKKVFINAKIVEYSGEVISMNEGCLSLPGLREEILRHDTVHIQYYDENMEYHDEVLTGYPARVLQHEYDHTYGTVFTDRVPKVKKVLLRNKLKAMANGRYSADYRTVIGDKKRREQLLQRNVNE